MKDKNIHLFGASANCLSGSQDTHKFCIFLNFFLILENVHVKMETSLLKSCSSNCDKVVRK